MESKIPEIKPMVLEPWVMPDTVTRGQSDSIKPIAKDEGASFRKLNKESGKNQKEKSAALKSGQAKELSEQIEQYLSDMNVSLSFEVYDKTGDVVVKVINRDTKEVIRQIPPEDLLEITEKLEELRGVLFAGKA